MLEIKSKHILAGSLAALSNFFSSFSKNEMRFFFCFSMTELGLSVSANDPWNGPEAGYDLNIM